jgi:flagellar transcriptional activator FlhD
VVLEYGNTPYLRRPFALLWTTRIVNNADTTLLADIREVNLSYLLLAQRMLRDDLSSAMFRLGFSREVADIVVRLSPAQLVKLASSSSLLCRFRFDDYTLLSALTHDVLGGALQQAHATILLAKQPVEELS